MFNMLIIAHRGASAIYPENTMLAFEKALEMGAHGLELDVQCSADGVAVVFHDDTLERTTNGSGFIKEHTLTQLKSLHVENIEHIAELSVFMARFEGETTLWLEIKDPDCVPELTSRIRDAVTSRRATWSQCVVIGFDVEALKHARRLCPELVIGYSLEDAPKQTVINSLKPAYVLPHFELATQDFVHAMAAQGIGVVVWTLNEINDSLRMKERGVMGIITDVPNILKELFEG